jgi:6-pyruvoyltetrahydropterin/6-carboxytetrahydropterin synthase
MEQFHVRIATDDMVFSAAHFITMEGGQCERLHGHNYRVAAEVYGGLNKSQYVVDFQALAKALGAILAELDHHVLLPQQNPTIHLVADDEEIEVLFSDRRWAFPRDDCALLPIANTTAELLAKYIGHRLLDALGACGIPRPALLRIEVEESCGHAAVWQSQVG